MRHLVFASTGGALYRDGAPRPIPKDCPPRPASLYGASKADTEALVRTMCRPGADAPGVVSAFARAIGRASHRESTAAGRPYATTRTLHAGPSHERRRDIQHRHRHAAQRCGIVTCLTSGPFGRNGHVVPEHDRRDKRRDDSGYTIRHSSDATGIRSSVGKSTTSVR